MKKFIDYAPIFFKYCSLLEVLIVCLIIGVIGLSLGITICLMVKKNINYRKRIVYGILLICVSITGYVFPYRFSTILEYNRSIEIQYWLGYLYNSIIGYLIIIAVSSLFFVSGAVAIITALHSQSIIDAPPFVKDLWGFLKVRKKYWLLPIILTLLFFGAIMIFAAGTAIQPFIYTIF